jgi:hypothetical protein
MYVPVRMSRCLLNDLGRSTAQYKMACFGIRLVNQNSQNIAKPGGKLDPVKNYQAGQRCQQKHWILQSLPVRRGFNVKIVSFTLFSNFTRQGGFTALAGPKQGCDGRTLQSICHSAMVERSGNHGREYIIEYSECKSEYSIHIRPKTDGSSMIYRAALVFSLKSCMASSY